MYIILSLCAIISIFLGIYSLGLYLFSAIFLANPVNIRSFSANSYDSVSVLIPAKNEGGLAVLAIKSIFEQTHPGPIDIYLLIKDGSDSSVDFLHQLVEEQSDFEVITVLKQQINPNFTPKSNQIIKLTTRNNKTLYIALTDLNPKSQKINLVMKSIDSKFVAILDCDNQAQPDWLVSSINLLVEQKAEIIQGRRWPILANGFYKFWDSLHQHIGCELLNIAFTQLKMTVFFTGTAAVMNAELLKLYPLSNSITEDIDFSYRIFMLGKKIIANTYGGSHEETSPDLYSFIARRRRWANGHTLAFFKYLPLILSAPITTKDRIQFLFHGFHYLIAIFVFFLHLLIGVYFFDQLSWLSKLAALTSSLIISIIITKTQNTEGKHVRFMESFLLWCWLSPLFTILMNLLHALIVSDLSRAALPLPGAIQIIGLIGVGAPLIALLSGLLGFNQLIPKTILKCLITYPIVFYLDIAGILLGLLDCLLGQNNWRPLTRRVNVMIAKKLKP